jgi:hypothetical protein|tara:strand:+ start:636 stop:875 length:240 start_codon:yes stop_codon:yes gene_type:complete
MNGSRNEITVWHDADFQDDRAVSTLYEGVEFVRDIPCDTGCEFAEECGIKIMDCVATRGWYYNGDYDDADVGRLKRSCK